MNSIGFKVDEEKCIHCGLCVKDCIVKILALNENKIPQTITEREKNCTKCQHCLSICPTGALTILDKNPENSQEATNNFNPEEVLRLIKERKSIRFYKPENVEKEKLEKLKEMLAYVPTGVNNHSLHFSIIEDVTVMDKYRKMVNDMIIKIVSNNTIKQLAKKFSRYTNAILRGEDVIFRGAPHMIVVSIDKNAPCKDVDPIIALSYFELYAKSLGIGTCWCGLAYYCLQFIPNLHKIFNVPKTHKIAYVMLFGNPAIEHKRTTQPEAVPVETITEITEVETGFWGKLFGFLNK